MQKKQIAFTEFDTVSKNDYRILSELNGHVVCWHCEPLTHAIIDIMTRWALEADQQSWEPASNHSIPYPRSLPNIHSLFDRYSTFACVSNSILDWLPSLKNYLSFIDRPNVIHIYNCDPSSVNKLQYKISEVDPSTQYTKYLLFGKKDFSIFIFIPNKATVFTFPHNHHATNMIVITKDLYESSRDILLNNDLIQY